MASEAAQYWGIRGRAMTLQCKDTVCSSPPPQLEKIHDVDEVYTTEKTDDNARINVTPSKYLTCWTAQKVIRVPSPEHMAAVRPYRTTVWVSV